MPRQLPPWKTVIKLTAFLPKGFLGLFAPMRSSPLCLWNGCAFLLSSSNGFNWKKALRKNGRNIPYVLITKCLNSNLFVRRSLSLYNTLDIIGSPKKEVILIVQGI